MSGLWESVPQVRWSGTRSDAAAAPPKAEPSVAANTGASVARKETEATTASPDNELAKSPGPSKSIRPVGGIETPKQAAEPDLVASEIESNPVPSNSAGNELTIADRGHEQIEKLRAALNNDAAQAEGSPRHAGNTHDVRLRVDSLVEKARSLFDLGQLREARHAAKIAHDLGDAARLDYSPEEERPIDLVQRIEDRIRETDAVADGSETSADQQTAETPPSQKPVPDSAIATSASTQIAKPGPSAKSPEGDLNGRRKDWTQGLSVFRRDRKPTPVATPVAATQQGIAATTPIAETPAIPLSVEFGQEPAEANENAVVQANRSLTLARAGSIPSVDDHKPDGEVRGEQGEDDDGNNEPPERTSNVEVNRDSPLFRADTVSWSEEVVTPRVLNIEDTATAPVDFDEVQPLAPFRDAGAAVPPVVADKPAECPRPADRSWALALGLFAICTGAAIFWYRRGAV